MPPSRKRVSRKPPIFLDLIKTIGIMNGFRVKTTIENIQEHLCNKVPRSASHALAVRKDPNLVKALLYEAVSEGKIIELCLPEEKGRYTYRVPKYFGERDRKYIVPFDDEIPGPAYFVLLKFAAQLAQIREARGITAKELLEAMHGDLTFLNYDSKSILEKLIPEALQRGHIECSGTGEATRFRPTRDFHRAHRTFCKNRQRPVLNLDLNSSMQNDDQSSSLLSNGITIKADDQNDQPVTSSESIKPEDSNSALNITVKEEPMDVQIPMVDPNDNSKMAESSPDKSDSLINTTDSSGELNQSSGSKEKAESAPGSDNLQPQRVSQRKKFRKTLGPDFVESADMNIFMHQNLQSRSSGTAPTWFNSTTSVATCSFCTGMIRSHNKSNFLACSTCDARVHTTCIKALVQLTPSTQWQCSNCLADNLCVICNREERKPDLYIVCKTCSQPYHLHCWREKSHSVCGFCPLTNKSPSEAIPFKVTTASISGKNVINIKSSSLLQSNSNSATGPSLIVKVCKSKTKSGVAKTEIAIQETAKPEDVEQQTAIDPSAVDLDQEIKSKVKPALAKTVKLNKDPLKAAGGELPVVEPPTSDFPTLSPTVKPVAIKSVAVKSPAVKPATDETPMAFKSHFTESVPTTTGGNMTEAPKDKPTENPVIICPEVLARDEATEIENDEIPVEIKIEVEPHSFLQPPSPPPPPKEPTKKRKNDSMDFWLRKPGKEICYHFQTWVESELKHYCQKYSPDLDLSPLASLPDLVTEWTSENVYRFVGTLGFKEEADTFLERDIDGLTLLLLSRYDFIHSLSIKIGPALKLFAVVNRLHQEM